MKLKLYNKASNVGYWRGLVLRYGASRAYTIAVASGVMHQGISRENF